MKSRKSMLATILVIGATLVVSIVWFANSRQSAIETASHAQVTEPDHASETMQEVSTVPTVEESAPVVQAVKGPVVVNDVGATYTVAPAFAKPPTNIPTESEILRLQQEARNK